ncbi:alginate lyase [Opitutaceae bacterium TAV4]|nr:alginate lyase [Opitutaceae bacterium TAV4]RRJ98658.1 alginate lyase [Opitutaceae bacterium TAV3]
MKHLPRLRPLLTAFAALTLASLSAAAETSPPALVNIDYADLLAIRAGIQSGQPDLNAATQALLKEATSHLAATPDSVVNKTRLPPSGDKHDFYAIGDYSWPNPNTPDGMPWIRRDGHSNPDTKGPDYDKRLYTVMRIRVNALALAWFYSNPQDERYAAKAADILRTWFIEPTTRMNPNFNYSSSLPGVYDGMAIGVIEGAELIGLLDSVKLLTTSQSWTPADNAALQRWFFDYTTWLLESSFGKEELRSNSNHGIWYDAQIAAFSVYSGDTARAREAVLRGHDRIAQQMSPDGSLPQELKRNRSLNYSIYALRAFTALARCGDIIGEDLWHYRTSDGRGLEKGFAFIAPYLANEKNWTWRSLDKEPNNLAIQITRLAAKSFATNTDLAPVLNRATSRLATLRPADDRIVWLTGQTPPSP